MFLRDAEASQARLRSRDFNFVLIFNSKWVCGSSSCLCGWFQGEEEERKVFTLNRGVVVFKLF